MRKFILLLLMFCGGCASPSGDDELFEPVQEPELAEFSQQREGAAETESPEGEVSLRVNGRSARERIAWRRAARAQGALSANGVPAAKAKLKGYRLEPGRCGQEIVPIYELEWEEAESDDEPPSPELFPVRLPPVPAKDSRQEAEQEGEILIPVPR